MTNEHYDSKTCPILKKCRQEAFFSSMKILEMIVLLLFTAGSIFVAVKTEEMIWRIGAVVMIAVCVFLLFQLNFRKLRGLHETTEYLKSLSYEEYRGLVIQTGLTANFDMPIYLLDGWLFAPSVPLLAKYDEITKVEVITLYYYGTRNGYTVKFQLGGKKREITMNRFAAFEPAAFKEALDTKMQEAHSGYDIVFSERKM